MGENFMARTRTKSKMFKGYIGGFANFSNLDTGQELASQIATAHFKNSELIDDSLVLFFEKILDLGRDYNISVVLVKFPVTEEYYNATGDYFQDKDSYYRDVSRIIQGYDDVYIMDYQKIYFSKPHLFRDAHHLNMYGAKVVSRRLLSDLKKLNLTGY